MTVTATLALDEETARKMAEALAADDRVQADAIDVHERSPGSWELVAYFGQADVQQRAAVAAVAGSIAGNGAAPEWRNLPDADWVRRSQEALPPVRAGRILVYGQHDRAAVRANDIAIHIEAGQAFGTGHHGTTRGCLLAIQAIVKSRRIRSALDIGTGSGVLAIALARQAVPVVATDIDPVAVRIARENARLNGVAARVAVRMMPGLPAAVPVRLAGSGYDLVVANILLAPLLALAPTIARAIAPGGTAILSGLLPDQRTAIVATYRSVGLRLRRWFIEDGWLVVVLEKPAKARWPSRTRTRSTTVVAGTTPTVASQRAQSSAEPLKTLRSTSPRMPGTRPVPVNCQKV